MTFYNQARRLGRWWTYFIVATVVLGLVLSVIGDPILNRLARTCPAPPTYRADVPADLRTSLDLLFRNGLLYCSGPPKGMRTMTEPIYWGSDGVSSILFYQSDDLSNVYLVRYGFGENPSAAFIPGEPGASPPAGFKEGQAGRAALTNQAPEGSDYFYRVQGAPLTSDGVVAVTLDGPAVAQPKGGGRDAFRDIETLWDWIRRKPASELESTRVMTPISIVPGRWENASRRVVNPALADAAGKPTLQVLRSAAPTEPTLYQTVSGLLHTTVWVAGVVSGTRPAMVLQPAGGSPGVSSASATEPVAQSGWISTSATDRLVLAHFAYDPLPPGRYRAEYWHDHKDAAAGTPDRVWEVTVP